MSTFSQTNALVTLNMESSTPTTFFVRTTTAAGEEEPCLVHIGCVLCDNLLGCQEALVEYYDATHVDPYSSFLNGYNVEINYSCGQPNLGYEISPGQFEDQHVITCDWDGSWKPSPEIPPCVCK